MELLGSKSSITIGANTSIGQNIHLVSAGNLVIGLNTTISAYVMISNVDHTYAEIGRHILQQPHCFKETVVGDNCFIGYGAVVLAGTSLGRQCVIGANAVVRGEYPDYCVLVGAPAKVVRRYSKKTDTWEKTNAKGQFINEE
jgi:acetyltransferase-like isoleucine patch superfamily enzyme